MRFAVNSFRNLTSTCRVGLLHSIEGRLPVVESPMASSTLFNS